MPLILILDIGSICSFDNSTVTRFKNIKCRDPCCEERETCINIWKCMKSLVSLHDQCGIDTCSIFAADLGKYDACGQRRPEMTLYKKKWCWRHLGAQLLDSKDACILHVLQLCVLAANSRKSQKLEVCDYTYVLLSDNVDSDINHKVELSNVSMGVKPGTAKPLYHTVWNIAHCKDCSTLYHEPSRGFAIVRKLHLVMQGILSKYKCYSQYQSLLELKACDTYSFSSCNKRKRDNQEPLGTDPSPKSTKISAPCADISANFADKHNKTNTDGEVGCPGEFAFPNSNLDTTPDKSNRMRSTAQVPSVLRSLLVQVYDVERNYVCTGALMLAAVVMYACNRLKFRYPDVCLMLDRMPEIDSERGLASAGIDVWKLWSAHGVFICKLINQVRTANYSSDPGAKNTYSQRCFGCNTRDRSNSTDTNFEREYSNFFDSVISPSKTVFPLERMHLFPILLGSDCGLAETHQKPLTTHTITMNAAAHLFKGVVIEVEYLMLYYFGTIQASALWKCIVIALSSSRHSSNHGAPVLVLYKNPFRSFFRSPFHLFSFYKAICWYEQVVAMVLNKETLLSGPLGELLLMVVTATNAATTSKVKLKCPLCDSPNVVSFSFCMSCKCQYKLKGGPAQMPDSMVGPGSDLLSSFLCGDVAFRYRYPGPVIYWLHAGSGTIKLPTNGDSISGNTIDEFCELNNFNPMWPIVKGLCIIAASCTESKSKMPVDIDRSRIGASGDASAAGDSVIRSYKISLRILDLLLLSKHQLKVLCSKDIAPAYLRADSHDNVYYPPAFSYLVDMFSSSIRGFCWEKRISTLKKYAHYVSSAQRSGKIDGAAECLKDRGEVYYGHVLYGGKVELCKLMRSALFEGELSLESKLSIFYDFYELASAMKEGTELGMGSGISGMKYEDPMLLGFNPPSFKLSVSIKLRVVEAHQIFYLYDRRTGASMKSNAHGRCCYVSPYIITSIACERYHARGSSADVGTAACENGALSDTLFTLDANLNGVTVALHHVWLKYRHSKESNRTPAFPLSSTVQPAIVPIIPTTLGADVANVETIMVSNKGLQVDQTECKPLPLKRVNSLVSLSHSNTTHHCDNTAVLDEEKDMIDITVSCGGINNGMHQLGNTRSTAIDTSINGDCIHSYLFDYVPVEVYACRYYLNRILQTTSCASPSLNPEQLGQFHWNIQAEFCIYTPCGILPIYEAVQKTHTGDGPDAGNLGRCAKSGTYPNSKSDLISEILRQYIPSCQVIGVAELTYKPVRVDCSTSLTTHVPAPKTRSIKWHSSWCEGRLWRCLFHVLLYEEIFYGGGDTVSPTSSNSRNWNVYPRVFHTYPCDLLPERYGVAGCPPLRCGFFRRCSKRIKKKLANIKPLGGKQVFDKIMGLFIQYYGSTSGQHGHATGDRCCATSVDPVTNIGCRRVGSEDKFQEMFEDYLLGDQCYVDVDAEVLASFAESLGGHALSIIIGEMAREPETYFRGMPDLMFWRVDRDDSWGLGSMLELPSKRESNEDNRTLYPWQVRPNSCNAFGSKSRSQLPPNSRVFAVEVKSKKDSLSKFQLCWLELLQQVGVQVEVSKIIPKSECGN